MDAQREVLDPTRTDILLGTPARVVEWKRNDVAIESARGTIRARAAIVTIPIGVWKAPREQEGALEFRPALRDKQRALENLEVGHVVKIMFRFAERSGTKMAR